MKKRVSLSVSGDEEDELEVKQYRTFTDLSLANTVSTILSIIAIGMAIVTEQPLWLILSMLPIFDHHYQFLCCDIGSKTRLS